MAVRVRQEFLKLARDRVRAGEQTIQEAMKQARESELRRRKLERVAADALNDRLNRAP